MDNKDSAKGLVSPVQSSKTLEKTVEAPTEKRIVGKSGKKICCSCLETKQLRDECVVTKGEDKCMQFIEAHKSCLRAEGFTVL